MNTREREVKFCVGVDATNNGVQVVVSRIDVDGTLTLVHDEFVPLAEGSASSEGAATEPAVLSRNLPCDPPTKCYTVEPHGDGMAIYNGRDKMHHGFNLGHLTEYDPALPKLIEAALNAYTAPKASSEGAEAVAWISYDDLLTLQSKENNVIACCHPDPALSIALYTHPQPVQGEHEQRSCEGSERRPIADVVERALDADERMWALIAAAEKAGAIKDDDDEGSFWTLRCSDFAALESALPRGLPAGSDVVRTNAAKYLRAFLTYLDPEEDESAYNNVEDTIHALERATAEQPSCGQDARDGERLAMVAAHPGFLRYLHSGKRAGKWTFSNPLSSYPFDVYDTPQDAIDAAIAAQQRQGGEP